MPKSSDNDGPTAVENSSEINIFLKLKLFFKKLFSSKASATKQLGLKADQSNCYEFAVEGEIINNIDSFPEKILENIMIPRSDIIAVSLDITLEELGKLMIKYTHTRIPVYKESLDNIVGFIHVKDIFRVIVHSEKFNLKKLIRKHIISPHSMKLVDLLAQMQRSRTHIAIVVDEYGGTDGLVTIENIIEEIVGRIDDEHDIGIDKDYKILKPGLIVTSARVDIEELENVLSTQLKKDEDEFDTIGGLIMAKSGNVPEKGEVINITHNVIAEILESTPRTIKQIKITYTAM